MVCIKWRSSWWRHQMETFSALLALCAGNPPANPPHKGQWRGALVNSLICAWTNDWVNNRDAGDLRRNRAHYDITVMHCSGLNIYLLHWRLCTENHFTESLSAQNRNLVVKGYFKWITMIRRKCAACAKLWPDWIIWIYIRAKDPNVHFTRCISDSDRVPRLGWLMNTTRQSLTGISKVCN